MSYLYNVATNKDVLITVRIAPEVRDQFKKAAELRGSTMSGLMHQFIVRTIREEKQTSPGEFTVQGVRSAEVRLAPIVATITPAHDPKDEIRRTINADEAEEAKRRTTPRKTQRVAVLKEKAK